MNYYIKLVLFAFVITTLPVISLGIFSYDKSAGVVLTNVNKQRALSLTQMEVNIEQVLKTADRSSTHFLSSYAVTSVLNEPLSPKQFAIVNELKTELNYLQRLDSGIEDITLLSKTGNWLMANSGLYRLEDWKGYPYGDLLNRPISASKWMVVDKPVTPRAEAVKTPRLDNTQCERDILLVKRLPLTSSSGNSLAVVTIPSCRLGQFIAVDAPSETMMILDEHFQPIYAQGSDLQLTSSLQEQFKGMKGTSGQFNAKSGDQQFSVSYRKSDSTGWIFVSAITVDQLTRSSRGIGWFTFWMCLMLLTIFVLLSWYWSARMYRPIGRIYRVFVDQQNEDRSENIMIPKSNDEIGYIGEQISSLFQTQKQLKDQIQGQMEQFKTFFMAKLFLGGMKQDEIYNSMSMLAMHSNFTSYSVMALQIDSLENTRFTTNDMELLMFSIHNMVEELIPSSKRLPSLLLGRTQITILTSDSEAPKEFRGELFTCAQQIQKAITHFLGLPVSFGISTSYQNLTDVPRAYEEALESIKSRARYGEEAIIFFADLGKNNALQDAFPMDLQAELMDSIKLIDEDKSRMLLHELILVICRASSNPYDQQFKGVHFLMNIMNLAHSYDIQPVPLARQYKLFDELFGLKMAEEGEQWFWETLIQPIISGIKERTELRHLQLVRAMVQTIQESFETDLSIETCAEQLHYNAVYLNNIFRNAMDITFSAYLVQYRHQMAKIWLTESDMSVKEISERLRYSKPQNFIRSFRKSEGLTPGKYRDLHTGTALMEENAN